MAGHSGLRQSGTTCSEDPGLGRSGASLFPGARPGEPLWPQRLCKLAGDIRALPYRDLQALATVLQAKLQPAATAMAPPTGPSVDVEALLAAAESIPGPKE